MNMSQHIQVQQEKKGYFIYKQTNLIGKNG